MNRENLLSKLKEILEEVLEIDDLVVSETTSANDIEEWDSIVHVEIIVAIEEEFDIKFNAKEIVRFKSLGDIISAIVKYKEKV